MPFEAVSQMKRSASRCDGAKGREESREIKAVVSHPAIGRWLQELGDYFLDLCGFSSSTRVTCKMATSLSGPSPNGFPLPGLPMNNREPKTQANSGCGTGWLDPSERKTLKGRKGFRPRSSLMRCGVIINDSYSYWSHPTLFEQSGKRQTGTAGCAPITDNLSLIVYPHQNELAGKLRRRHPLPERGSSHWSIGLGGAEAPPHCDSGG